MFLYRQSHSPIRASGALFLRFCIVVFFIVLSIATPTNQVWAHARTKCAAFRFATDLERRHAIRLPIERLNINRYIRILRDSGRLVYRGVTNSEVTSPFLLSNERITGAAFFDRERVDLLVAFGTNSSWEIAANGNAKHLVIADWSPYPILAQAFIIEPLLRIAKTPTEWMQLLDAEIPYGSQAPVETCFGCEFGLQESPHYRDRDVERFLRYLSEQPQLSNDELRFLAAYFHSRVSYRRQNQFSPFASVRSFQHVDAHGFVSLQYSNLPVEEYRTSVLHNSSLFSRLKNLYAKPRGVSYAWMDVRDLEGYRSLRATFDQSRHWTVSLSNILDMPYVGLHNPGQLLVEIAKIARSGVSSSTTFYATTRELVGQSLHEKTTQLKVSIDLSVNEFDNVVVTRSPDLIRPIP